MDWSGLVNNPYLWGGISLILFVSYGFIPDKKRNIHTKFLFIALPAAVLTYSISLLMKDFLAIPRPCLGLPMCPLDFSMPSSHSAVAFAALGVLGYLSTHLVLILAVILALSRVVEGVHTWPDVILGAVIGLIVANLVYKAYEKEFVVDKDGDKNNKRRNKNTRNR